MPATDNRTSTIIRHNKLAQLCQNTLFVCRWIIDRGIYTLGLAWSCQFPLLCTSAGGSDREGSALRASSEHARRMVGGCSEFARSMLGVGSGSPLGPLKSIRFRYPTDRNLWRHARWPETVITRRMEEMVNGYRSGKIGIYFLILSFYYTTQHLRFISQEIVRFFPQP